MKVLFVFAHDGSFRFFEGPIRELARRGHRVTVAFVAKLVKSNDLSHQRAIKKIAKEKLPVKFTVLAGKQTMPRWLFFLLSGKYIYLFGKRELYNYLFYRTPGHTSRHLEQRYEKYFPRPFRPIVRASLTRAIFESKPIRALMNGIESIISPDNRMTELVKTERPDIVIASPYIFRLSFEVEAVRAARRAGVPGVVAIQSWDNLTTKGTFQPIPDKVIVWNEPLKTEATKLHHVPAEDVIVTGASVFDDWFTMKPSATRKQLNQKIGFSDQEPYLIYLCSSQSISRDEIVLFEQILSALEKEVRQPFNILIRPHPLNWDIWVGYQHPKVRIYPAKGAIPDTPELKQEYFNCVYHSAGVIGVNTSAFLEAAITDRPCLTLITEKYQNTQGKLGHFQHLKRAGFMEIAASPKELAKLAGYVLSGRDQNRAARRQFVRNFIRPVSLATPASAIFADQLERLVKAWSKKKR